MPVMACSPLEQGRLVRRPSLVAVAADLDGRSIQVTLAWLLGRDGVIAIPKAGNAAHVRKNRTAADLALPPDVLVTITAAFAQPERPTALEML